MTVREQRRYSIGVDIGSTTVKTVLVETATERVLWKHYQRHETHQAERTVDLLRRMEGEAGIEPRDAEVYFSGSGGSRLAQLAGARFVQEVTAVSLQVERVYPHVQSVIELGGQDAKIIVFREQGGGRDRKKIATMNDKCAGGTGAVLDKLSAKLNIPSDGLCRQRYAGLRLHPVAGKCGVFAETDINGLQKQGIPSDELMASLFEAIVLQNLSVLTRGNTLLPYVLLLGGPNAFIPGMQEAWRAHIPRTWEDRRVTLPLGATPEQLIFVPHDGVYFAALGAVAFGREECDTPSEYVGADEFERRIERHFDASQLRGGIPALLHEKSEKERFVNTYQPRPQPEPVFAPGEMVEAWLGIDGGSTSTKAVLVNANGAVLRKAYQLSRGNPIEDAIRLTGELREAVEGCGAKLSIKGVGVTGYAKDVLAKLLRADVAVVETVAHAQSALRYVDSPDVIVDVGGQDIKLMVLKDGHVKDFMLNTQCSAGNGYFLQATAESFGVPVEQYADVAFEAREMPEFGYGCAVFLQSDIVNFQRQGWRKEEILAGLAAVLPKNIWLYVAKIPNLADLGQTFVLQGGTQRNMAAVKAQVDYIQSRFHNGGSPARIVVHPYCGEAGAIGAAMEAARVVAAAGETRFVGLDAVRQITWSSTSSEVTRCGYCHNQCLRTFIDFEIPGNGTLQGQCAECKTSDRIIIANCERGAAEGLDDLKRIQAALRATREKNPNLVEVAARQVWKIPTNRIEKVGAANGKRAWPWQTQRTPGKARDAIRIGIPRVLNYYATAPFFLGYLSALGVAPRNIVFSEFTSDHLYREGANRGAVDPCFPSKVTLSHVHNLLHVHHAKEPLDIVFLPMFETVRTPLLHTIAQHACPTVMATPETVKAAFIKEEDVFARLGVRYLNPLVDMVDEPLLERQMFETWREILGLDPRENREAVASGLLALKEYERSIRAQAREALEMLERERRMGIVLLGRPYHHDPGLSHGIAGELQKLGYPVFSQATLPMDEDLLARLFGPEVEEGVIAHPLDIRDVWKHAYSSSTNMKVWGAKFVARHPNLVGVELSNFRCGHDAPTYHLIEEILESAGKPYFAFRDLDENKAAASMKIRFQTIDYFLTRHKEALLGQRMHRAQLRAAVATCELAARSCCTA